VEDPIQDYEPNGQQVSSALSTPLMLIHSSEIELVDVFVPDHNRLANADTFEKGLNTLLMASRLTISWIFVGAMASSFEYAYDYAMKNLRNGIPIARSQLVQERFVRMMGEI